MGSNLISNFGAQPFLQAARSHLTHRLVGYFRFGCRNFHWAMSLFLTLALIPAFRIAELPWRFEWHRYLVDFWLAVALESLALVAMIYVLLYPIEFLRWINHPPKTADFQTQVRGTGNVIASILLPTLYLFLGFLLVFCYNDVIASLRFTGAADLALNRIDSWLLGGNTISNLAHKSLVLFPSATFDWMGRIYTGLFPQVGVCLVLLALRRGKERAMQFTSTILTSYFLALILFYFLPATGPYFICPEHFSVFPKDLSGVYGAQVAFSEQLNMLRLHQHLRTAGLHYYIAFPCMHLAQPIILLWYLREWKRLVAILLVFDAVLIPSIVLLEQHYVIDLVGGVIVAIAAILMIRGGLRENSPGDSPSPLDSVEDKSRTRTA
jgi:PAP2 superfamily